jgi:hypothetical protein
MAQLVVLALLVLLLVLVLLPLALLELEELQPTVSSRLPATAALAVMAYLARKITLPNHSPRSGDQDAESWLDKSRSWLAKTNGR